jgi:hypothetical protein
MSSPAERDVPEPRDSRPAIMAAARAERAMEPPKEAPPAQAAKAEMTPHARAILENFYAKGETIPMTDAMDKIIESRKTGMLMKRAIAKATQDGRTNWELAGAVVLGELTRKGS